MTSSANIEKDFSKVSNIINENNNFLIISHIFPDGDSLGSQVALHELLLKLNKNSYMICNDEIPYQYKFLPSIGQIKRNIQDLEKKDNFICFCLDSADKKRMGIEFEEIKNVSKLIINIDHHMKNTLYGSINIVDSKKSATAEMIYELIKENFGSCFCQRIAIGIYTGILTDTGRFQYENTTSNVHKIISHLLQYGIFPSDVFSNIYENDPINRFKLLELVFKRINFLKEKKLIYSYILQKDFKKLNLPFSAQDGIIEILRSVSGVKVAALIKQIENNDFKISLRTSDNKVNVAKIAAKFGGGGHQMAAAYAKRGKLKDIISSLISEINFYGENN